MAECILGTGQHIFIYREIKKVLVKYTTFSHQYLLLCGKRWSLVMHHHLLDGRAKVDVFYLKQRTYHSSFLFKINAAILNSVTPLFRILPLPSFIQVLGSIHSVPHNWLGGGGYLTHKQIILSENYELGNHQCRTLLLQVLLKLLVLV